MKTLEATRIRRNKNLWQVNVKEVVIKSKFLLLAMNAYQNMDGEQYSGKFSTVYYSQFATRPLNSNEMSAVLPNKEGCWDTATIMSSFRVDNAGRIIIGTMGNSDGYGKRVHSRLGKKKAKRSFSFSA